MVAAMVLGGLRRCEVVGLRLADVQVGDRRVFVVDGKGGHQRLVPVSARFFTAVADYLERERPAGADTDRLFLVLKGPRRGRPLTAAGLDEVLAGARVRAGLAHATCHELRHTCLTRLREAGMALEAVQAQAGHASLESTRIYLHLADDWLASQYRAAAEAIDAQMLTRPTPAPTPSPPARTTASDQGLPSAPTVSAFVPRASQASQAFHASEASREPVAGQGSRPLRSVRIASQGAGRGVRGAGGAGQGGAR
jgi:hypothetical protein